MNKVYSSKLSYNIEIPVLIMSMNFKYMSKPSLKVFILVALACTLTIQLRIKQNHQVIQTSEHIESLPQTSSSQQLHFTAFSMSINYTQEILKLSSKLSPAADINDRYSKVQKSYLSHQDQVNIMSNFTFSPLETDQVNCQSISADTVQALLFRTSEIKAYLENSLNTNQVNFITNSADRPKAKQGIQNQIAYLKGLEVFLSSGCTKKVKISETFFVSNPNANNWILGDWTYDNFIKSYLGLFANQTKVNKCPIDRPFYDSTTDDCINCVYPNNIWSMKQRKCISCPYAQIVNVKTRTCVSEIRYASNIMGENYPWITDEKNIQVVYDQFNKDKALENVVVCPFDTPFIINQKCSTCSQKFVYSLEKRQCLAIPYNMEYDKNLHKVVQKLSQYQTNAEISSNVVQNLRSCPTQYPYYDSVTCINCVFPNYFNERRKICEPCSNLDLCGVKKLNYISNSLGSNVTGKSTEEVKAYFAQNAQKFKDDSVQQCPIATPYYNPSDRKCIQCPIDKFLFDINTLTCVSCPPKSFFNQVTYLCEIPKGVKTYSKATNLIVENLTKYNEQQNKITGKQCSEALPYFNGKQCISCPKDQLFNTNSKTCVYCPLDTTYDNVLMKCDKIKYKTNSLTDRLWIANVATYQNQYKINPAKQCPLTQPFYNGTACINCAKQQIFNTSSQKCTQCPTGTIFNNINKACSQNKANFYVPGKTDNLLGVPSYSVDDYIKEVTKPDQKVFNVVKCAAQENSKKTECVKCDAKASYFNVKTLECVPCKQFDKEKKICYDIMTYLTNTTKSDMMLGVAQGDVETYIKTQDTKFKETPDLYMRCPGDKPYSVKGVCQTCEKYFNVKSLQCVQCQTFDKEKKICIDTTTYLTNTTKIDMMLGVAQGDVENFIKTQDTKFKENPKLYLICPGDKPYSVKGVCQTCEKYFNVTSTSCTTCQFFDPATKTCGQAVVSKSYISNLKYGVPAYYTKNTSQLLDEYDKAVKGGATLCPFTTPFFNGKDCIVCPKNDQYFNLDLKKCENCTAGYQLNLIINECQEQPPKYYTALESPKLIFDGQPSSYYQYKIDQAKKAGKGPCPKEKPYYTKNNQCETCSAPTQYFNLLRRVCTNCPENTKYSTESSECESPIGDIVTPQTTLEKSLANFFT